MAHPLCSFLDTKTNQRYYQVWDTITGYPHTVPLSLLNLLQYKGLHNQSFVRVLYQAFDRLLIHGSTLYKDSFSEFPDVFKQQAFDFLELNQDVPGEEEISINNELEALFCKKQGYFEFWIAYQEIIQGVNIFARRPFEYYKSWSEIMQYEEYLHYVPHIFEKHHIQGVEIEDDNDIFSYYKDELRFGDFDCWFKKDYFKKYPEAMAELFYQMAKDGSVLLQDIPHILRLHPQIKPLFSQKNMAEYLPDTVVGYNVRTNVSFDWKHIEYEKTEVYDIGEGLKYDLLELQFMHEGRNGSLFLFPSQTFTSNEVNRPIKDRLDSLLYRGEELALDGTAGIVIYKELVEHSNYMVNYFPCCLNIYRQNFTSGISNINFQSNYRNDDFEFLNIHSYTLLRSEIAYHALFLSDENEQIKSFYRYTCPSQKFYNDADLFSRLNPKGANESLSDYHLRFESYLLAQGYESLRCYTQNSDEESLIVLLGRELNAQGGFDPPEEDPDELPL